MSNTISSFTDLKWKLFRVMKHYIRSLFHLLPFRNRMPSVLMLTKAFLPSSILASDKDFVLYCACTFLFYFTLLFSKEHKVKSIKMSSNPTRRELTFCLFYLFISHSLMTFSRRVPSKEKELVKN